MTAVVAAPKAEPLSDDSEGAAPPVLSVRRARIQFGPLVAVRDVSFELGPGTLLGLIGPNGAGKTTLLRAVAGLQPLTAGGVQILGHDLVPGAIEAYRHIGFTPDTPPFYEQLSVRNFLKFIAKGYDLADHEADERIDFWLEKVWLREKADQKIKALSRGMRQRIGIARTLLPNPALVLLDEPAAGLDPAGRVQFRQLLIDLRDQGKALIVSSHILSDMEEYCTHIGIMAQGQMMQYGTAAQVAAHHDAGRCRYTLVLARPVARVEEQLAKVEGLNGLQVERDRLTFEYHSGREDAAALLANLVRQGLPVASFAPNAAGLEEAYLRIGIRQVD